MAVDLELGERDAARHLHRAVVAEELVRHRRLDARVRAQQLELVAVAQERERAVADQVDGRLVAGDVEQDQLLDELLGR